MNEFLLIKSLIFLCIFAIPTISAIYLIYFKKAERPFSENGEIQKEASTFGFYQTLADARKLFTKEDFISKVADKWLFLISPSLTLFAVIMASAVIPFGDSISYQGQEIFIQAIEVNIGLLWVFAVVSMMVYGTPIRQWISNSQNSFLGAVLLALQNIPYVFAISLSFMAIIILSGSLSLRSIIEAQHGHHWNIFYQPLGYLICYFAVCKLMFFDLPESKSGLEEKIHLENRLMNLGLYLFSRYAKRFMTAAVIVTLYLGGYNYPGMESVHILLTAAFNLEIGHNISSLIGFLVFFIKIAFFIYFTRSIQQKLSKTRYTQLIDLAWKLLIPLAILNLFITALADLIDFEFLFNWLAMFILIALYYLFSSPNLNKGRSEL